MTSLSRHIVVAVGAALLAASGAPVNAEQDNRVSVTVKYTGAGTVDDAHRIWVWLFDDPDIGPGSMPIGEESLGTNGGTVTFNASARQVYVAVAYDAKGGFFGQAPPPSGAPVAVYGIDASNAAPRAITPGPTGSITITFDDTMKMP